MREDLSREKMHKAIDSTLSGLNGDPWLFRRVKARAEEGETKMKKKLSAGLILAIVLILLAAAAMAVTLLTHQEVVEQVAVPLAVDNDTGTAANTVYSTEDLAQLVRSLNENGITLEENDRIMQALQNGQGYYEEEAIMEICRRAFGGNFYTWTLEQQDWFQHLMVDIGWYESYESSLPGEDNMTCEAAEAFAFAKIREEYGEDLPLEDRTVWQLERQFYMDNPEDPDSAAWYFTLEPKDLEHGHYYVSFSDRAPEETVWTDAVIHDWTQGYTGEELLDQFYTVYSWVEAKWPQEAWQKLHEMLQKADIVAGNRFAQPLTAYRITEYPDPDGQDIPREEAVEKAREALQNPRAALDGAVLTEYGGIRTWMISFLAPSGEGTDAEEEVGLFAVSVDSRSGETGSIRKSGLDDSEAFAYVPEAAYEKAWEGILRQSEIIRIAADALVQEYPEMDPLNEEKYEVLADVYMSWHVTFRSKDIHAGDASVSLSMDGEVREIEADTEPLDGDNLFTRCWMVYGYFGSWEQSVWVQLEQEMAGLEPQELEGKLLKAAHYPEESTARIQHDQAKELGIAATGKRAAEVNTCVLVDADPHPVWIMRILTDEADDPLIGIDAETGETVFREQFKVDYTPHYTLYSMPEKWRKAELEEYGVLYMAKVAITHKYGDMEQDFPEIEVDNETDWEVEQDGLTVRCTGRWKGMKSYEVELDENGYVLRCEESESPATEEKPADLYDWDDLYDPDDFDNPEGNG